MLCCAVLNDTGQIQVLSLCRRCVADDVVGDGVVDEFAHGVDGDDDVDDVRGCRTGIASRIAEANKII